MKKLYYMTIIKHGKLHRKKIRLTKRPFKVYNKDIKSFLLISNLKSLSLNAVWTPTTLSSSKKEDGSLIKNLSI